VANAEYSATTLVNTIYDWMVGTANFGPSEREGGNGLNFISAADPRVPISATIRLGQDGSTRVNTILGYPNGSAPTRLATGVEARLIEAEAALKAGNAAGMMTALNTARADAVHERRGPFPRQARIHCPHSSIRAPMPRASICSFASGRSGCT